MFPWRDENNTPVDDFGMCEQPVRDSDDLKFAGIEVGILSWIVEHEICVCHDRSRRCRQKAHNTCSRFVGRGSAAHMIV